MPNPIIKIKNLSVTYFLGMSNEVQALRNINLEIYPGEFIIFFGPSGCGKSTLLYAISGLETETAGNIYIGDKDIAKFNHKELEQYHQKQTGMIFQAYYLINSLSVLKNVILPQIAIGGKKKNRKKRALELLEHFSVKEQAKKLPNELSGGQQQRVAICRSLVNDPDILFADEPVGNLDSKSSNDVMELLKNLNEKQKKTIILVTHDPSHLNIAHRVFYIKDGYITDIKTNRAINKKIAQTESMDDSLNISKDLELLIRTYSNLSSDQIGGMLIPFKAKQIVSEALIGMTNEDIERIEKEVENLLLIGIDDNNETAQFFDLDARKGGMGMDKRTAEKLNQKIKNIIAEIRILRENEDMRQEQGVAVEEGRQIEQLREYLFKAFEIEINNPDILAVVDSIIKDRIENKIDKVACQKRLDLPIKKHGAGLDRRIAKKMAKRLELLILGKYK